MKICFRLVLCFTLAISLFAGALVSAQKQSGAKSPGGEANGLSVPVTYYKLPNGLRVVLSQDKTAPLVVSAVYYNIGFRIEPRDRTGFAHLFEHLMFQGSQNLGKMEFIKLVQQNGGILNGSTRFDFTNYFEVLPSNKLETALWAEADRMRGLKIDDDKLTNQKGVVGNEVKVNVLNTPYGGFPWLDMPQYANSNWYNAHNFYGDLKDIDAATLKDAQDFFNTFYSPNNAVLVIVGDFELAPAKQMVEKYFSSIPAVKLPPKPDLTEPRQDKEKIVSKKDPLARRPALAFAYHMPDRNTPDYYAMGLLDQLLLQGEDSLLYQELVKKRGFSGGVSGGINPGLGNMFNYNGPMLWVASLIHDNNVNSKEIMSAVDAVVQRVQDQPVDQQMIDRARVKLLSGLYDYMTSLGGFGRADLLASFALFDDDPKRINSLETQFRKVTPAQLQKTAREYLRSSNRTVLTIEPAAAAKPASSASSR
jgi:predicted Zn-dependent peptidase